MLFNIWRIIGAFMGILTENYQNIIQQQGTKVRYSGLIIIIAIAIIYLLALFDTLSMYNIGGANWDFITHWLMAKSLVNNNFYSALFGGYLSNSILYSNTFYFESLRAPLTGIFMVPFSLLGSNIGMPLYFAFVLFLLLYSIFKISASIKIDPILLILIIFTPYISIFLMLLNGTEIVSIALLLIFLSFLFKKSWKSGIILALAGLAKYPNLIFLPLLFFLPKKERKNAFASFFLITIPWLLFNTVVFHDPIFSYVISVGAFSGGGTQVYFPINIIIQSLLLILPELFPIAFIILIVMCVLYIKRKKYGVYKIKLKKSLIDNYKYKIAISFFVLGIFAWSITSMRGSINDLPRLGYLIYTGAALFFTILFFDIIKKLKLSVKNIYAYCIIALFIIYVIILLTWFPYNGYVFYGSKSQVLLNAENSISIQGIGSCNIISNNWVYLKYLGYKAHFPYYYNSTSERYPIIFFTDLGSNQTPINLDNITFRQNYSGFFIAKPKNSIC